jgi:hypothetical protein
MTVEIINRADGGPLFKIIPEPGNNEDVAFMSQFYVNLPIAVEMTRVACEGEGEWIAVR